MGIRGGWKGWEAPKVSMDAVKFCAEELEPTLKAKVSKKSRYLASNKSLFEACIIEGKRMGLEEKGEGADITRYMGVDHPVVTSTFGMKPTRKKRRMGVALRHGGVDRAGRGCQIGGRMSASG